MSYLGSTATSAGHRAPRHTARGDLSLHEEARLEILAKDGSLPRRVLRPADDAASIRVGRVERCL